MEELAIVRALLKRSVFELPAEHAATMKLFRDGGLGSVELLGTA